jgi:hypothetical protein
MALHSAPTGSIRAVPIYIANYVHRHRKQDKEADTADQKRVILQTEQEIEQYIQDAEQCPHPQGKLSTLQNAETVHTYL